MTDTDRLLTEEERIKAQESYIKRAFDQVKVTLYYPLTGWRRDESLLIGQRDLTASLKDAQCRRIVEAAENAIHMLKIGEVAMARGILEEALARYLKEAGK